MIRKHIFVDIRDEIVWENCGKDQQGWYGYKEGKDNGGSISTLLSGNGKAKLVSANLVIIIFKRAENSKIFKELITLILQIP